MHFSPFTLFFFNVANATRRRNVHSLESMFNEFRMKTSGWMPRGGDNEARRMLSVHVALDPQPRCQAGPDLRCLISKQKGFKYHLENRISFRGPEGQGQGGHPCGKKSGILSSNREFMLSVQMSIFSKLFQPDLTHSIDERK